MKITEAFDTIIAELEKIAFENAGNKGLEAEFTKTDAMRSIQELDVIAEFIEGTKNECLDSKNKQTSK